MKKKINRTNLAIVTIVIIWMIISIPMINDDAKRACEHSCYARYTCIQQICANNLPLINLSLSALIFWFLIPFAIAMIGLLLLLIGLLLLLFVGWFLEWIYE